MRRAERVLLVLPNCPEFVIAFLAIQKLGAVVVNVGPLMGRDDLQSVVGMTNPRVAIGLDLQAATLHSACHGSTVEHLIYVSLQTYQPVFKRLGYQVKLWQNRDATSAGMQHILLEDLLSRARRVRLPWRQIHRLSRSCKQPVAQPARLNLHSLRIKACWPTPRRFRSGRTQGQVRSAALPCCLCFTSMV